MMYIYTQENCPNCEIAKANYRKAKITFIERDASRLKNTEDQVDLEGLILASIQNMVLPVVVDYAD